VQGEKIEGEEAMIEKREISTLEYAMEGRERARFIKQGAHDTVSKPCLFDTLHVFIISDTLILKQKLCIIYRKVAGHSCNRFASDARRESQE
jgi:hypothetical protein